MHIDAIRVKNEVEKEDIRVKLKLFEGCQMSNDIWNENMVIYKTSGDERNRKDTRKSTKKDISTSTFNKLYCYHNENRNIASRVKDPICYDDTLS